MEISVVSNEKLHTSQMVFDVRLQFYINQTSGIKSVRTHHQ